MNGNLVSHPDIIGSIEGPRNWSEAEKGTVKELFQAGFSDASIATKMGRTTKSVTGVRFRLGLRIRPPYVLKPVPADLAEIDDGSRTNWEVCAHYECSDETLRRWRKEVGTNAVERAKRPVPDDWAEQAAKLYTGALGAHYGVSGEIIRRWIRETGITPPAYVQPPRPKKWSPETSLSQSFANTDNSLAGRAADHLRRAGFVPVYNYGKVHIGKPGNDWVVGTRKLTSSDMIDLAEAKGFNADGWKMVA